MQNRHLTTESTAFAIDGVVAEVLESAGVISPPIDAIEIARRLDVTVAFDQGQESRARHKRLGTLPVIFLRPDDRAERLQWATAHELGEFMAWRIAEQFDPEDLAPDVRESLANEFASRLLLPGKWFIDDAHEHRCDLFALKSIYTTASHELIATRTLDLDQPAIVSVFDHGRLVRRRWNGRGVVPRLHPIERECQSDAHGSGRVAVRAHGTLEVRAWPIHEDGWKREIVRAALVDEALADCE